MNWRRRSKFFYQDDNKRKTLIFLFFSVFTFISFICFLSFPFLSFFYCFGILIRCISFLLVVNQTLVQLISIGILLRKNETKVFWISIKFYPFSVFFSFSFYLLLFWSYSEFKYPVLLWLFQLINCLFNDWTQFFILLS